MGLDPSDLIPGTGSVDHQPLGWGAVHREPLPNPFAHLYNGTLLHLTLGAVSRIREKMHRSNQHGA